MSYVAKSVAVFVLVSGVAGCDLSGFESAPVEIETELGPVSCQLYTLERTQWDHAITFPEGASKESADALCQAEGLRLLEEHMAAKEVQKEERTDSGGFLGILNIFKSKSDTSVEDAAL